MIHFKYAFVALNILIFSCGSLDHQKSEESKPSRVEHPTINPETPGGKRALVARCAPGTTGAVGFGVYSCPIVWVEK